MHFDRDGSLSHGLFYLDSESKTQRPRTRVYTARGLDPNVSYMPREISSLTQPVYCSVTVPSAESSMKIPAKARPSSMLAAC